MVRLSSGSAQPPLPPPCHTWTSSVAPPGLTPRGLAWPRPTAGPGASNIIPEEVGLSGTIRAFSNPVFAHLRRRVTDIFTQTAAMYGCSAAVEWSEVRAGGRRRGAGNPRHETRAPPKLCAAGFPMCPFSSPAPHPAACRRPTRRWSPTGA